MTPSALAPALNGTAAAALDKVVFEINRRLAEGAHPMRVRKVAGGYQMHVLPEFGPAIEAALVKTKIQRLTRAGLETLAIIAYKQPCSTPEIEQIRGVSCGGVLSTLMERNLITITGRSEGPGRPLQYGTTREFLNYFGLNSLNDLPSIDEIEELLSQRSAGGQVQMSEMSSEEDAEGGSRTLILKRPPEQAEPARQFRIMNVRSATATEASGWMDDAITMTEEADEQDDVILTELTDDEAVMALQRDEKTV
ncbi:MAG: SMC-Scp complex subunit ScpB [candidate division Zixibacteria bacterium]|nr:SMC-Scp complex subunit ScpB [candidate division Zixibacteria bacterium]